MTSRIGSLVAKSVFLVCCCVIFLIPSISFGVVVSLTDDAYTVSPVQSSNTGKSGALRVTFRSTVQTGWLKFDLSTVPPGTVGSQVAAATVRLFAPIVGWNP